MTPKRPGLKGKQARQIRAAERNGIGIPDHLREPGKENSDELRRILREHEEGEKADA
jgi:hypothetical protein